MKTRNKLDIIFGPAGSSAGMLLFVVGLFTAFYSLTGMILVLAGAFMGFTSTSTTIDFDKKRLRFSNNIFGIFPIGKWILIQKDMKIGLKKSNKVWRTYSRSNRTLDVTNKDYRLILFDSDGREIMPLQKSHDLNTAKSDLDKLSKQLGIGVI